MEHRKRHMMQHKTEVSILMRLAMANKKVSRLALNQSEVKNLVKSLAAEAMKSASKYDRTITVQLIA